MSPSTACERAVATICAADLRRRAGPEAVERRTARDERALLRIVAAERAHLLPHADDALSERPALERDRLLGHAEILADRAVRVREGVVERREHLERAEAAHRLERRGAGILPGARRHVGAGVARLRELVEDRKPEQPYAGVGRVDRRGGHREPGDVGALRRRLPFAFGSALDDFVFVGHARPAAERARERRPERTDVAGHDDQTAVRQRLLTRRAPERRRIAPRPQQVADGAETHRPEQRAEPGGEEIAGPFEVAGEEEEIEGEERAEEHDQERAAASEHGGSSCYTRLMHGATAESGANQNRSASCTPDRFRPTSGRISRCLDELLDAPASLTVTFRVMARSIRPPTTAPTAIAA